jgi:hypothetical protein
MIEKITPLQFLTATLIIEVIILFLFRFTHSPLTGPAINRWYNNFTWTAVIMDILSVMIGFYLAKYVYEFLVKRGYITRKYEFWKYLAILLAIQITHDICFYFFVILPTKPGKNSVIDELKSYSKSIGAGAIRGDSFMYIVATPILYYLIVKYSNQTNTFISIVCLYLVAYFLHQKPVIKM